MKILVISNFFPPAYIGGYELGCGDVVSRLVERGHEVVVLTSTHEVEKCPRDSSILRVLDCSLDSLNRNQDIFYLLRRLIRNRNECVKLLRKFKPDIIYCWNMQYGLIPLLFVESLLNQFPVAVFASDHWIARLPEGDPLTRRFNASYKSGIKKNANIAIKKFLSVAGLRFRRTLPEEFHLQFCSDFLRDNAQHLPNSSETIHWGVDLAKFEAPAVNRSACRRFLFAGQLIPHKGLKTAVEAFVRVLEKRPEHRLEMVVAGAFADGAFEQETKAIASKTRQSNAIRFVGKLSREELGDEYARSDVFVFASEWHEPFSIALVEAMASGLLVIGTQTGGSPEILCDKVNGLAFEAGNVKSCEMAMLNAIDNEGLQHALRENAVNSVVKNFCIDKMVTKIEKSLLRLCDK